MVEAMLIVAMTVQHFRLCICDSQPVRPVAVATTHPSYSPKFRLEAR
jgi:hypothetical protein